MTATDIAEHVVGQRHAVQKTGELVRLAWMFPFGFGDVLEIGVMHGGTLWYWFMGGADRLVAVDKTDWPPRNRKRQLPPCELITGASQSAQVIESVRAAAPNGFDIVFVDADHAYSAVKADYMNYWPMVKPGGYMVFHDVCPCSIPDIEVDRLWSEIEGWRPGDTLTIIEPPHDWGGFGLLRKPKPEEVIAHAKRKDDEPKNGAGN